MTASASRASRPTIIIDTREQEPYEFDRARVQTVRRTLPSGDYSVEGLEDRVAVERKSLDDFAHSVIRAQDRFFAELRRLQSYSRAWVVVEGSIADVLAGRYSSRAAGAAVLGLATTITVDLNIPVLFAGDRPHARRLTEELLIRCDRTGGLRRGLDREGAGQDEHR